MKTLTLTIAAFATATAFADWNLSLTSGWRVIGGANYNSGLKTDLKVSGARALPHMPSAPASGGMSRSQAETAAKRVLNGQAVSFDNGAFIDPDYSGKDAMPDVPFPDNYSTAAVGPCLGYIRRGGQHGISGSDWIWMLDFADRVLGNGSDV